MTFRVPDASEFHSAAMERAREMAEFARAASGEPPLNDREAMWLEVGLSCGITTAVEELHDRNMLGEAS